MREVRLDCLRGDEERLGDLAVRLPLGRHLGDSPLARGKRVDAAENEAPRPRPGREELDVCAFGQDDRATPMGEPKSVLEEGAGFGALVGATESDSQLRERLGPLELRL